MITRMIFIACCCCKPQSWPQQGRSLRTITTWAGKHGKIGWNACTWVLFGKRKGLKTEPGSRDVNLMNISVAWSKASFNFFLNEKSPEYKPWWCHNLYWLWILFYFDVVLRLIWHVDIYFLILRDNIAHSGGCRTLQWTSLRELLGACSVNMQNTTQPQREGHIMLYLSPTTFLWCWLWFRIIFSCVSAPMSCACSELTVYINNVCVHRLPCSQLSPQQCLSPL